MTGELCQALYRNTDAGHYLGLYAWLAPMLYCDCHNEYKARSVVIGRDVTVVKLNESYPARVIDINPDYSLLIEHDGVEERLFTGEISIRI